MLPAPKRYCMKQILVWLCEIIAFALPLIAQEKGPSIAFVGNTADFNRVPEGETIHHVFKFANKGDSMLHIVEVQSSCGCLSTLLTSKNIGPGESGQIDVRIETTDLPASSRSLSQTISLSKIVTVNSNDRKQPTVILTINAMIVPEIVLSDSGIHFGTHRRGEEVTKDLLLEITPDRPITLISAASTDNRIMARLEPVSNSGGKKVRVIATLMATAGEGQLFGTILVKTSSPMKPEIKIPVLGTVTKNVLGSP